MAVSGTHVYVADYYSGLQVIDITNPQNPQLLSGVDTPGSTRGVVVVGGRAYVADGSWTSLERSGTAIKAAIAYDTPIAPGEVLQISGIVMATTNCLVVRSDTASSLGMIASGVSIT